MIRMCDRMEIILLKLCFGTDHTPKVVEQELEGILSRGGRFMISSIAIKVQIRCSILLDERFHSFQSIILLWSGLLSLDFGRRVKRVAMIGKLARDRAPT